MNSIMIAFAGKYRPLCFEGECLNTLGAYAKQALTGTEDAEKLSRWIDECVGKMTSQPNYASTSAEHCGLSVSVRRRAHDKFLDAITSGFPHYPNANYRGICN